ncbi:hypothetical protein [Solimicrobium silvestre]|uniref:Uncharacterized protein n=1 Tax=Solimicrobium silvestre TaxID=2099400 RepID=A0A2S9H4C0_9BURK|nr:hypothetical protein [Solimicrobium silvestre]PRC94825.1 hypothetical protein S2091_0020 [Solimicrobium silvestre]
MDKAVFDESGIHIVAAFLDQDECSLLNSAISNLNTESVGTRNLLNYSWC